LPDPGRATPTALAARPVEDRCPGIVRLHPAGDGLLARVRLPGGRLSATALGAIGDVAALGSGIVELTSRANVQVRGLDEDAAAAATDALWHAGLLPSPAHDRVRNILAGPLGGRHPASVAATDDVVVELDRGLCADAALAALPGRFLFAVDDGSGIVDASRADVALLAEDDGGPAFRLSLGDRLTDLTAPPDTAAELALAAARAFLALVAQGEHPAAWRIADLADGRRLVAARLDGDLRPPNGSAPRRPPLSLGMLTQSDGRAAVTVLPPLGRLDQPTLRRVEALLVAGSGDVRVSSRRTLTFVDVAEPEARALVQSLVDLGFVASDDSGWWGLSACAGTGACVHARVDVRAAATARAGVRAPGAPAEHWSACERGCGRPRDAGIGVTAVDAGLAIERGGARHAAADLPAALELLAGDAS